MLEASAGASESLKQGSIASGAGAGGFGSNVAQYGFMDAVVGSNTDTWSVTLIGGVVSPSLDASVEEEEELLSLPTTRKNCVCVVFDASRTKSELVFEAVTIDLELEVELFPVVESTSDASRWTGADESTTC